MNNIYFPNSILVRICSYLHERDVKALGMTSKRMLEIAKKCLDGRDMALEKLLLPFTQARHFNIKSAKDADVFAVGEDHEDEECLSDQMALIKFLLVRGPVIVLHEGFPSMKLVPRSIFESRFGECNLNFYGVGWDNMNAYKLIEATDRQFEKKINQLKKMKQYSSEELFIYDSKLEKEREQLLQKKENLIKSTRGFNKEVIGKDSEHYIQLRLELTKIKIEDLEQDLEHSKLLQNSYSEGLLVYGSKEHKKYQEAKLNDQILNVVGQRSKQENVIISYTFPSRTRAMCHTLQKIGSLISQLGLCDPKIVLIAGWSHLETDWSDALDGKRNLISFYEELKNHKAVVLLPTQQLSDDHIGRIKNFKDPVQDLAYKVTRIVANYDVGFGKSLYIRGNADHLLNWKKGLKMVNEDADRWTFTTIEDLPSVFSYKVLIDDVDWEKGDKHEAKSGQNNVIVPQF